MSCSVLNSEMSLWRSSTIDLEGLSFKCYIHPPQNLMEKRIGPWINKKIVEYIGEEELTLTEFICNKVQASLYTRARIIV